MKFLTDEEILALWFAMPGRIGPVSEVLEFARQVEQAAAKEVIANAKDTLQWMDKATKEKA